MGLLKSFTDDAGCQHTNAYHKVTMVKQSMNAGVSRAFVEIQAFKSREASEAGSSCISAQSQLYRGKEYANVLAPEINVQSGKNMIRSIYADLKANHDFFKLATDVLEA